MVNLKSNKVQKAEAVEPIKNKKDVKKLVEFLHITNVRNYAIVVLGINTLLRAGDLLSLKWNDVLEDENTFKLHFSMTEDKTDKTRKVNLNTSSIGALMEYKQSLGVKFKFTNYIFKSRKGDKAIDVKALHKIIKDNCRALNIKGNFGTHTLRKTGAYRIYVDNVVENPMIISYLQEILNHSSQRTTLRYIGIEAEKITDIFMNLKHY